MVQYHGRSNTKRSGSGGVKKTFRDKRKSAVGGFFSETKLDKEKELRKVLRVRGGGVKVKAKKIAFASVSDGKGKTRKVKIINVVSTPSNALYARENVIVKGSVLEVEGGKIKVSSRPGQDGVVNGVWLEQSKAESKPK
ncbi:MAG: 30S ribosomal protein S8e [Candidatus Marsarchaeota archaeon]|nr:30S ribosomal protein S8e [Candidatus Marsarchaeota archaeon]